MRTSRSLALDSRQSFAFARGAGSGAGSASAPAQTRRSRWTILAVCRATSRGDGFGSFPQQARVRPRQARARRHAGSGQSRQPLMKFTILRVSSLRNSSMSSGPSSRWPAAVAGAGLSRSRRSVRVCVVFGFRISNPLMGSSWHGPHRVPRANARGRSAERRMKLRLAAATRLAPQTSLRSLRKRPRGASRLSALHRGDFWLQDRSFRDAGGLF
jgi:hypothetical protein